MRYPHLAARIFNTPLLVHPQKLDAIIAGLGTRLIGMQVIPGAGPDLDDGDSFEPTLFSTRRGERTDNGTTMVDGVAVVRVMGALSHRTKLDADSNYILGYDTVAARLEAAMDDPEVHAIAAIVDSPGGEAQGAFELAQRTLDFRGKKPLIAVADGMAASAAYLFASAADELVVTSTGYAGSIGVAMRHIDFSRMLANEGIGITHIFAGAHKVDGNQFQALPAAVRADFQAEINALYDMFVGAVARQLDVDPQMVRSTEARTYMGEAAVRAGLATRMATADQVLTELAGLRARTYPAGQSARSTSANGKGASMSGNNPAADGNQSATPPAALTAADVERARSEGFAAGVSAECARIQGVEAALIPGHEALIQSVKFDGKTTGGEAALQVLRAERELRATRRQDMHDDAPQPLALRPSSTVRSDAKEPMSRSELDEKAKAYQVAHPGTSYVAAVKHVEATAQQGA